MSNAELADDIKGADTAGSGKKGLVIGLALALCAAGGGFYAASSGLIFGSDGEAVTADGESVPADGDAVADIAFVPIDPITVSLGSGARAQHLRFRGELEVPPSEAANVEKLLPRIVDVLNGYLRAVEPATLQQADILPRLRAQMVRRVRLVVGEHRVNDLLIMEFILK